MDDLMSFRLDVWTDGKRDACAVRWTRPEASPGLHSTWFVLERAELDALCSGEARTLEDGYHRMSVSGEACTFYDWWLPGREAAGEMRIPFATLELPRAFWRYLGRIARFAWRHQRTAQAADPEMRGERLELPIPLATIRRFQRRYRHASGRVDVQASERFHADLQSRGDSLRTMADRIRTIAQGYTRNVYHTVALHISNDGPDGYYWSTCDARGRRGLCGGLINHGARRNEDDWSIHT